MNHYGQRAMTHWRTWRPTAFGQISDPEAFFTEMGERASTRIDDLTLHLAGEDPPWEEYLEKVGRLRMARLQAEERVLPEEILAEPEPQTLLDEESTSSPQTTPLTADPQDDDGWMATTIGPGHPLYQSFREEDNGLI